MSNAPYGYRYIPKTDEATAAYLVDEAEAQVVRRVYEMYTVEGLSIGEITRRQCMTRGQDGLLFLSCRTLSFLASCRFIPAFSL